MKKGQKIWAKKLFDDYKDRLTEGRGYTIISSNSDGIKIIDDNGEEIYNGLIWFECFFSLTPPYEPVLIAEQPKEKTAEEIHDELHAILNGTEKDLDEKYKNSPFSHPIFDTIEKFKNNDSERLFTAALAAMQGFIASYAGATKDPDTEPVATKSWNYAEALINEGKKRNLL